MPEEKYSRFELVRAAYQAYNQGWSNRTSFDIAVEKHGEEKLYEEQQNFRKNNPDKLWVWDNPYEGEYRRLQKVIDDKTDGRIPVEEKEGK